MCCQDQRLHDNNRTHLSSARTGSCYQSNEVHKELGVGGESGRQVVPRYVCNMGYNTYRNSSKKPTGWASGSEGLCSDIEETLSSESSLSCSSWRLLLEDGREKKANFEDFSSELDRSTILWRGRQSTGVLESEEGPSARLYIPRLTNRAGGWHHVGPMTLTPLTRQRRLVESVNIRRSRRSIDHHSHYRKLSLRSRPLASGLTRSEKPNGFRGPGTEGRQLKRRLRSVTNTALYAPSGVGQICAV